MKNTAAALQPDLPVDSPGAATPEPAPAAPSVPNGGELGLVPSQVAMFERLATNPDVDVAKLEKLIEMQERILRHNAKADFDAAFSQMQGEIPIITERGEIAVNGVVRSKYARFEDILAVVRPILQRHGFAIRHRNQFADGKIKIVGILSHRSGHSEEDEFEAKADDSGSKNAIQALGSTRSYGQRYTTISLLNIATKGADDDGAGSTLQDAPAFPEGYEAWLAIMEGVAENGWTALSDAWNKSKPALRGYMSKHQAQKWAALKSRAQKVTP